ncbi:hypothetical protein HK098_005506 [Nowakowskiella sp. JEL0407]|nr:hypothetical protein HK098_005506 [Nowakowskiella sp. JEL0407]
MEDHTPTQKLHRTHSRDSSFSITTSLSGRSSRNSLSNIFRSDTVASNGSASPEPPSSTPSRKNSHIFSQNLTPPSSPTRSIYKTLKDDLSHLFDPNYSKSNFDFESDEEEFLYSPIHNTALLGGHPFPPLASDHRQNGYPSPRQQQNNSGLFNNNSQTPLGRGLAQIVSSVRNVTPSIATNSTSASTSHISTPQRNAHLRESHLFHTPNSFKHSTSITPDPHYYDSRQNSEESTDFEDESAYLLPDGTTTYGTITPKSFANITPHNKNPHVLRSKPNWPSSPIPKPSQNSGLNTYGDSGVQTTQGGLVGKKFRNSQTVTTRTVVLTANSMTTFKVGNNSPISHAGSPQSAAFIYRFPRFDEDGEGYFGIWQILYTIFVVLGVCVGAYFLYSVWGVGGVGGRLARDVGVGRYDVELMWSGSLPDGVSGNVAMLLDIKNRVNNITVNVGPAVQIHDVEVVCEGTKCPKQVKSEWRVVRDLQVVLITLSKHIGPQKRLWGFVEWIPRDTETAIYTLNVKYNTTITHVDNLGDRGGIFYSEYSVDYPGEEREQKKVVVGTKLKPVGARNVLPCLDEPGFPAIFKLSMIVPSKYFVLSNTPVSQILPSTNSIFKNTNNTELSMYKFTDSPILSPHYFSFVVTDLDKIVATWSPSSTTNITRIQSRDVQIQTGQTGREVGMNVDDTVTLSVYHQRGRGADALFALQSAVESVEVFMERLESYERVLNKSGILGSLKKLDIVGVDGLKETVGGWGLVMIDHDQLTLSATGSPEGVKANLLKDIKRTIAHHWFGGYKPINWWNENWLSEGLAHYFQSNNPTLELTTDYFRTQSQLFKSDTVIPQLPTHSPPQKIRPDRFLKPIKQKYLFPHAIYIHEQQITTQQISSSFDDIVTKKIGMVFTMVSEYLRSGGNGGSSGRCDLLCETVKRYVHSVNQTSATAFIDSVPVGEANSELKAMLESWIWKSGYPVLSVSKVEQGFKVSQDVFTEWKEEDEFFEGRWVIPVAYSTGENGDVGYVLVNSTSVVVERNDEYLIVDPMRVGVYRVQYEPDILKKISSGGVWKQLDAVTRAGILTDSVAMLKTNRVSEGGLDVVLSVTKNLQDETDPRVWGAAVDAFYDLELVVSNSSVKWNSYLAGLLDNIVRDVVFNATVDETYAKRELADLVGEFAVSIRHPAVVDWAIKSFRKLIFGYCQNNHQEFIPEWLLDTVYSAAMRYNGDPELVYDFVLRSYLGYEFNSKSVKSECINGATSTGKRLPGNLLKALFTTPVRELQVHSIFLLDGMLLDGCRGSDGVNRERVMDLLETMIEKAPGGYFAVWEHVVLPNWWETSEPTVEKKSAVNIAKCIALDGMANGNLRVAMMVDRIVQRIDNLNLVELLGGGVVSKSAVGGGMYTVQRASARSVISKQFKSRWAKEIDDWSERNLR